MRTWLSMGTASRQSQKAWLRTQLTSQTLFEVTKPVLIWHSMLSFIFSRVSGTNAGSGGASDGYWWYCSSTTLGLPNTAMSVMIAYTIGDVGKSPVFFLLLLLKCCSCGGPSRVWPAPPRDNCCPSICPASNDAPNVEASMAAPLCQNPTQRIKSNPKWQTQKKKQRTRSEHPKCRMRQLQDFHLSSSFCRHDFQSDKER